MNRFITSLIVVLAATNLSAQQMAALPKLVVGITVDQLRSDYIHYLYQAFGEKGFKRLIENGLFYDQVGFDFNHPDATSAMATIMTGTYPNYHGVLSQQLFHAESLRKQSPFHDPEFLGNYTQETLSPAALLTSTLTDELKVASQGLSRAYAIAPNKEHAILGAGHAADGAFWLNEQNGKWATTTYYPEVPSFVERYNRAEGLDERIHSEVWVPMLPVSAYRFIPYVETDWSFKHDFVKLRKPNYTSYKTSALVNDEVNRFVAGFLKSGHLGENNNPDFLSITYYAGGYKDGSNQLYDLETQDTYLRLDQSIGKLLDMIDQSVGLNNAFIFLSSTGNFEPANRPGERHRIPTGEFYPDRCVALLNTYMMALYGHQSWVTGYHNQQIYLNRKAILDHKLSMEDIQTKAAEFVIQFSGVQDVITAHQLLHGNWNERIDTYRNSYHRKLSGDLILALQPGWDIVYDKLHQTHTQPSNEAIATPLILFGPQVEKQKIGRPIDATEIAPTVARILRIRSPNASKAKPLQEVK